MSMIQFHSSFCMHIADLNQAYYFQILFLSVFFYYSKAKIILKFYNKNNIRILTDTCTQMYTTHRQIYSSHKWKSLQGEREKIMRVNILTDKYKALAVLSPYSYSSLILGSKIWGKNIYSNNISNGNSNSQCSSSRKLLCLFSVQHKYVCGIQ